jgi:MFS family permease
MYIAVDYALAVDCLPHQQSDAAKDLALWGVSAFLGTMFGPCLAGPLLAYLGHIPHSDHYSFAGYVALMACGVVYSAACGFSLVFVRREK